MDFKSSIRELAEKILLNPEMGFSLLNLGCNGFAVGRHFTCTRSTTKAIRKLTTRNGSSICSMSVKTIRNI